MNSEQLETITEHLTALQGQAYFKPGPGPLRERLAQEMSNSGEVAEAVSVSDQALEVSVFRHEGGPVISFGADRPDAVQTFKLGVGALDQEALQDLAAYLGELGKQAAEAAAAEKEQAQKSEFADYHVKETASARLKVSPDWLKRVVPCTDYSYEEIDGRKYIREYYWSKPLIERLFKIKSTKTTPEDLQYVAKECCDGDMDWARDLIAKLKSPNRPDSPAKEQPQKNQARQAQPQAPAGERSRSRSRNRRHGRESGKEGAKPQPSPQK